jgi:glycine reductase
VIAKEIEKQGIPVTLITAMSMMARQIGANRIVTGTKIPHPCGDPNLPAEADQALRKKIVEVAINALQTDVDGPTIFDPGITFTYG